MANYERLLNFVELSSDTPVLELDNIPQTGSDLLIRANVRTNRPATNDAVILTANDTALVSRFIYFGNGSNTGNSGAAILICAGDTATTAVFSPVEWYVMRYAATDRKKRLFGYGAYDNASGQAQGYHTILGAKYDTNTAINKLTIAPETGSAFKAGSNFAIYAITSGSDGTTAVS